MRPKLPEWQKLSTAKLVLANDHVYSVKHVVQDTQRRENITFSDFQLFLLVSIWSIFAETFLLRVA